MIDWTQRFKHKMKVLQNNIKDDFAKWKCPIEGYTFGVSIDSYKCKSDCVLYNVCDEEYERMNK